ncbi:hypothetical protein BD310DRAFT_915251 [Dichomitus squalens]|uniref:Secreted protein n=1 Tax=Dichomitus squalens TaxID=114155 RepID=A0A4Q9Q973_9APHY|nr:hypothetical protein BD310DRAFT_915251 [Dichomitus squalens]
MSASHRVLALKLMHAVLSHEVVMLGDGLVLKLSRLTSAELSSFFFGPPARLPQPEHAQRPVHTADDHLLMSSSPILSWYAPRVPSAPR